MEPYNKTLGVKSGSPLYLRCVVLVNPEPHWTWKKDGEVIQSNTNVFEKKDAVDSDAGTYMCVAKNKKGEKNDVTQKVIVLGKMYM